jgi:hypothetical protein
VSKVERKPICPDTVAEVTANPFAGDLLCFDGKEWRVARREDWNYYVPDPRSMTVNEYEDWWSSGA